MKDSSQIRKRTTKVFSILYKESLKIKSYFLCEWETFSSENNFNVEKIFSYEKSLFKFHISKRNIDKIKMENNLE